MSNIAKADLGPYGTTEAFLNERQRLLNNKPKCPTCGKTDHVNIYIQLAPTNWICSKDNTRWNQ